MTFEVRFTDNWENASAIVIRLKFIENNILWLKYYYFNFISVVFMPFKLCLNRNHHNEFFMKSVNIN